jgi:hypothetical protein
VADWVPVREVIPWLPQAPYFVGRAEVAPLRSALRGAGFDVFDADASSSTSERQLLLTLGDALAFPDYYGANWAAFEDCLGDIIRAGPGAVAVLVIGLDTLMRSEVHAFVRCVHFLEESVKGVERAASGVFQFEVFYAGDFALPAQGKPE